MGLSQVHVMKWEDDARSLLHPRIVHLWQVGRKTDFSVPIPDQWAIGKGDDIGAPEYAGDLTFLVNRISFVPTNNSAHPYVRMLWVSAQMPMSLDQHMFYRWVNAGLCDRDNQLFSERLRDGGYPVTIGEYPRWCEQHRN